MKKLFNCFRNFVKAVKSAVIEKQILVDVWRGIHWQICYTRRSSNSNVSGLYLGGTFYINVRSMMRGRLGVPREFPPINQANSRLLSLFLPYSKTSTIIQIGLNVSKILTLFQRSVRDRDHASADRRTRGP